MTQDPRLLARAARLAKLAAAVLRWAGACAVGWAALLGLSIALASFDRSGPAPGSSGPASGYLDFDLAVLRELADRSLAGGDAKATELWARRPDWVPPAEETAEIRMVPVQEAWSAAAASKSRFRTAARGVAGTLPFLLAGLCLVLCGAGLAGAVREASRRRSRTFRIATNLGVGLLAGLPILFVLEPAMVYERTASVGLGFGAVLFVAAFAGALPGAAARELFATKAPVRHLSALANRPAIGTAARLAVLDATGLVVSFVPVLAVAALFVSAKADQDPALQARTSGLGALIRSAFAEPSALERTASAALVGGAVVLLWLIGHRFVVELRHALGGEA